MVALLLLEGGTETVHTGIVLEEETAGVVGDGVPVGVDEDQGCRQFGEKFPHNGFHGRSEDELDALFERGGDGQYPLCRISQEFPVIRKSTQKGEYLFLVFRLGHFISASTFRAFGITPTGKMV